MDGLVRVGDLALITGGWDSFKSTFALELAWSLATMRPFLGMVQIRYPLRMMVVQTEIDGGSYDERLQAYAPTENLFAASDMSFTFDRLPDLVDTMEEFELDGVVLDPIGDMWPESGIGGEPFDENRKTHVTRLLNQLKRMGKTTILVHHDPKGAGQPGQPKARASGSSALLNAPDTRIFLDRLKDSNRIKASVRSRLQAPTREFEAAFTDNRRLGMVVGGRVTPRRGVGIDRKRVV